MWGIWGDNEKLIKIKNPRRARFVDRIFWDVFQILDNDAKAISKQDKIAIESYSIKYGKNVIDVLDDSYQFDGDTGDNIKDNLRSPKFIFNLLQKFDGEKKCVLCDCKIESM